MFYDIKKYVPKIRAEDMCKFLRGFSIWSSILFMIQHLKKYIEDLSVT